MAGTLTKTKDPQTPSSPLQREEPLKDWTSQVGALVQWLSLGVDTQGEMYVLIVDDVFPVEPVR